MEFTAEGLLAAVQLGAAIYLSVALFVALMFLAIQFVPDARALFWEEMPWVLGVLPRMPAALLLAVSCTLGALAWPLMLIYRGKT